MNKIHEERNTDICNNISNTKRKAILPSNKKSPPTKVTCAICKDNKLNGSGLCSICSIVICNEHTYVINEKKYCITCRNDSEYRPVLTASSKYFSNKSKWYCCIKRIFK